MVQDDEPVGLDGVRVVFDDDRVVSDAGIALVATLAGRLQVEGLVGRFVRLRRDRPGAANAGRKVMALIFAMLLGADSIDDCDVLRAGRTRRLLGGWLPAPPTAPRTADAVSSTAFSNTCHSVSRVINTSMIEPGYSNARIPVRASPMMRVWISLVPS